MLPSLSGGRQGRRSLRFRVAAMQGTLCRRSCSWVHGSMRAPRRRRRAGVCFPNDDLSRTRLRVPAPPTRCAGALANGAGYGRPPSCLPWRRAALLRRVVGLPAGRSGSPRSCSLPGFCAGRPVAGLSEPPPGKQVFWPQRAHPGRAAPRPSGGVVWLLRQQGVSRRPPSLRSSLRSSARMTRSKSRRLLT